MEDGRRTIAKIPHPNAGPPVYTTASEVATMEFARTILNIPVPKVISWSATDQNPVNASTLSWKKQGALSFMKYGRAFTYEKRPKLSSRSWLLKGSCFLCHLTSILTIPSMALELSVADGLRHRVGSLYFNDWGIPGSMPAKAMTESQNISERIQSRFSIGPIARGEFWEKERSSMTQYHGPCTSSQLLKVK